MREERDGEVEPRAHFQRKPNRLLPESYLGFGEYFLTLCTDSRKTLFERRELVEVLLGVLREACSAHRFTIVAYCFMPDHLHLLVQAGAKECDLPLFVKTFKGRAAAAGRLLGIRRLWQKGYYDHVIRNLESGNEIAWYIFLNPVRAGLAGSVWEWPHSGSFVFDWKEQETPAQAYVPPWKRQEERK